MSEWTGRDDVELVSSLLTDIDSVLMEEVTVLHWPVLKQHNVEICQEL